MRESDEQSDQKVKPWKRGKGTEIEGKDALFVKYWKFVVFCKKRLRKVKKESILSNGKNSVTE